MLKNPEKTLLKIFQFLVIPNYTLKNPQKQKSSEYKKMDEKTRKILLDFYKPHNEKFFQIIQERFDWNF